MGDRLKGRNIVVTGAGSGIGAGVAADLADNGANVVVADINVENGAKVADRISKGGGKAVIPYRLTFRTEKASRK
jgi:meso-butanediol dehydrogenase/(S,S)-butanediol dehydrogenase/diacetyl reductase